jgi:hypothetical protein
MDVRHRKDLTVSVSCAVFIPKPCTPFQWEAQIDFEEMLRKQRFLRSQLRTIKGVNFSWHGAEPSIVEGALARGDRRIAEVLVKAYEDGAKFDSWTEFFDFDRWKRAFESAGLSLEDFNRARKTDENLPWDFIDSGVPKEYLLKERALAFESKTTANCRDKCNACGVYKLGKCTIAGAKKEAKEASEA